MMCDGYLYYRQELRITLEKKSKKRVWISEVKNKKNVDFSSII